MQLVCGISSNKKVKVIFAANIVILFTLRMRKIIKIAKE